MTVFSENGRSGISIESLEPTSLAPPVVHLSSEDMVPPNMQIKDRAGGPAGAGAGSIAEARALRDKAGRKEGVLSLVLFISLRALFRGRSVALRDRMAGCPIFQL